MVADVSASLGFVFSGLVPLLLLLCFKERESQYENVWRISFALGIIVSGIREYKGLESVVLLTVSSPRCRSSGSDTAWPCPRLNVETHREKQYCPTISLSSDTGDLWLVRLSLGSSTTM